MGAAVAALTPSRVPLLPHHFATTHLASRERSGAWVLLVDGVGATDFPRVGSMG